MSARSISVTCPTCRQPSRYDCDNPWRPFCSERCRGVDLGAWASEAYRVPAQSPPDGEAEAAPPVGPRH